jgi:multiple sugar transport system ATP-binding protein
MTVADNMAFSLRLAGVSKEERMRKVTEAANVLHLGPLLERRPKELSGGQRQRVAIGRAIVRQPKVFLFDEPLSNLDAALRVQMRIELAKLHEKLAATMIYVTHDQIEAMTMADKIVVLQGGVVEQVGSPLELYHHPRNLFVAGFIGSPKMNLLPGRVIGNTENGITVELASGNPIAVPVKGETLRGGDEVTVGIRPEHIRLTDDGEIPGTVLVTERLGGLTFLHIQVAGDQIMVVQAGGDESASMHDNVRLTVNPRGCHLFGRDGLAVEHTTRHHLIDSPSAGRRSA